MDLHDTPARYGAVSVFNHWLGAAMIVALLDRDGTLWRIFGRTPAAQ